MPMHATTDSLRSLHWSYEVHRARDAIHRVQKKAREERECLHVRMMMIASLLVLGLVTAMCWCWLYGYAEHGTYIDATHVSTTNGGNLSVGCAQDAQHVDMPQKPSYAAGALATAMTHSRQLLSTPASMWHVAHVVNGLHHVHGGMGVPNDTYRAMRRCFQNGRLSLGQLFVGGEVVVGALVMAVTMAASMAILLLSAGGATA